MSQMKKSNISWTNFTVNFWQGCHKIVEACKNCYMFRDKIRYGDDPNTVVRSKPPTFNKPYKIQRDAPGSWVFTCSWSDFFIEEADPWRDDAWKVLRETPLLKYLVLTKRIERVHITYDSLPKDWCKEKYGHVWLGVTAGNQEEANYIIPLLLDVKERHPWLKVFVSLEPLIGKIDLTMIRQGDWTLNTLTGESFHKNMIGDDSESGLPLDWVIVGGESGPAKDVRPTHPDWVRLIRDQCKDAEVPFFFKQWGEWLPKNQVTTMEQTIKVDMRSTMRTTKEVITFYNTGRVKAGCLIDGEEYKEFPES